jgi:2-polyprenyl-6-methoxyphenol hydroxylase-like FAD-dependent oxidoreductase
VSARGGDVPREVVIIGGSTAGLFTAYHFARTGAQVELFEQAAGLQRALRTLIVTSRMLEVLGGVGRRAIERAMLGLREKRTLMGKGLRPER